MDRKAALQKRLEQLSPAQRSALLQKVAEQRQPPAPRSVPAARYALSLAQRRLWLLSQFGDEANAAYNIAAVYQFDTCLDRARLLQAWQRLLADHEVLRSAFSEDADGPFQMSRDATGWNLGSHALAAGDVEAQLVQLAANAAAQPFDLRQDWLLRVIHCEAPDGQSGLVIVIHHIVCDGLSISGMIEELAAHYRSAPQGDASTALQYRDYVEFEAKADTAKARAYWKAQFASAPETLDALLDLPRPAVKDFRGGAVALTLAPADAAAFETLCHAHKATLYMGLVALTQVLLARMANVSDVTLGTPVAGRPNAAFGRVVGPFVNTIALRQHIDLDASFADLLQTTRRQVLDGFTHQALAFDQLVAELGFDSDPSRSPLYDVMLGFNAADEMALVFGTATGRALRLPQAHSKMDLTFHFEKESGGGLRLDLEYATSVLLESSATRLVRAWQHLCQGVVQQSTLALGAFALQSDAERRLLLDDVNATTRPYPQQASLAGEFRRKVQADPDAIAVHAGDLRLSYRELDVASDRVAHWLSRHPAHRPGCRIALMLEKDARAIIVMLGILKSRGVYVPIAANTPLERVSYVLEAGEVSLLFAEVALIDPLADLGIAVIDTDALLRDDQDAGAPLADDEALAAADPAYLMFTSGSTGMPKGTLIEQRSVLRLVCNTDYHQVQPRERVLLTGSLAFDAATFEIWGALLNGGCVCIPAGTTLLEVHEFHTLVSHYQVDTAFLTTGLVNQLVDHSVAAFGTIKTVLTGGEKVSVEHVGKLLEAHPSLILLHVYGPTENTTFSSWHRIRLDDLALPTIPIGRPIANSRLYLLDRHLQPVPIGMPGEIYCGGDGIARGYVAQRVDAPAVFMDDPFVPGGRLYKTGDLGKWNQRRELVFLGRNDRQVKIRGFRVELGEVEYHLRALPGIADAFVQARGESGTSELVAWLVAPAGSYDVAALRDALQGSVPNYMMPAKIVCLERLPLNASGKVDARALPEPEAVGTAAAPAGQLLGKAEQDLARLYAKVLGFSESAARSIDRGANFFSLGGDSIRAIQLVALARAAGYHFTLRDILASDTLAGLAESATVVVVESVTEALLLEGPMSPTQRWWLEQCGGSVDHFNLSSVFRIDESLDLDALREALDELVTLHPALRLTLDISSGRQRIRDEANYVLRELDAEQTRPQLWDELQRSIALDAGVLLAVGVAPEEKATYLAVVVHHLAADEVSGRLFAENLQRLYQRSLAWRQGEGSAPEPIAETCGLINWAAQLETLVTQGALDADLDYWQTVATRSKGILERQQDLFAAASMRGEASATLPVDATRTVLQLSQDWLHMAPQELLLAAFVKAWQGVLGSDECLLSLEGHGREGREGLGDCSTTLGWFTSIYPFAVSAAGVGELDLYRVVKDRLRQVPAKGSSYLPLRYYKAQEALAVRPLLSFNYLGETAAEVKEWLQPAHETAGADHGADVNEPFKLDVLARIEAGRLELLLRGHAPREALTLDALASAWATELERLSTLLHGVANGNVTALPLLSLSDTLTPFASLAALDTTLSDLQLPTDAIEEIWPLTGMQAGMWLHCATHPNAYQDQVALRLRQPLDEARFAEAVAALVAETQALRTGFAQAPNGELLQCVFRARSGNYRYLDAGAWGENREAELVRLREGRRGARLDLLRDPLFSLTLVRLATDCFELIVDFHHMAIDGWTSALLLERLEALYFNEAKRGDSGAANGMRSYFQWLGRQSNDGARDYWQRLLGDYRSRIDVPAYAPRLPAAEPQPVFVENRIGATRHAALVAWCARQGLSLNAAVQALWGLFLARQTGSDDLVFGATVAGRDIDLSGVERIAGMLINTLPLRIDLQASASFADLARHTAQQFADSLSCGHLSLAEIQSLAPARAGLVTHTLVFENYPSAEADARWSWEAQDIFDPMHFEFGVIVAPLSKDLSFRFVADGTLYPAQKLERLGAELGALLDAALNDERSLAELAFDTDTAKGWTVSANFTADSLANQLQYREYASGRSGEVTLLPYDQSVQELINPQSRLRSLKARRHVVLWRPVTDAQGAVLRDESLEQLTPLIDAVAAYARHSKSSHVTFVPCPWLDCEWPQYREFCAYAAGALAAVRNAAILNLETLAEDYALEQPCHPPALIFGDIPYTEAFFAALAGTLARRHDLNARAPVKVYVVDADDTLWGGIVGEDGVQGIRLEEVHLRLQRALLKARAAGALICVASKNNEADVQAVFEQREMPLRWEHLTRVCAGWAPKSQSVAALARELSLGLDSFVFLDDSPLECAEVLAACPGVLTIQLPAAEERDAFLRHLWLLDAKAATREDAARAQMYAEELQRSNARKATGSYAEFLASLDIRVDMQRLTSADLPRAAQLSQRTNQFNTVGIRYAESELDTLMQQRGSDLRCVRVQDKYGDYGLVGSLFIQREQNAWTVFGFMLSCRVLGRGVEHAILRQLAQEAGAAGAGELRVNFTKLARNAPALQFLESLAATGSVVTQSETARQFVWPVTAAAAWQPGQEDAGADEGEANAAPETAGSVRDAASQDVGQLASRASAYYGYVAHKLASGAAILHEMQAQGAVRRNTQISGGRTAPATPTETTLAGFFSTLLNVADICREDAFHDLGGHSLKAMMLFSRIAAQYGVHLDFHDLQAHPTLGALAARIDAVRGDPAFAAADMPALHALPPATSYPVSPGQSRLWMLEQIRDEGPSPFHMHATLTVPGCIDRQALDLALQAVFARHEALRTCFSEDVQGRIRQSVLPIAAIDGRVQWLAEPLQDDAIATCAETQNSRAFDLSRAPLLRVVASELRSGGTVLFLTMHHIISDGWSVGILSKELSELYRHYSANPAFVAAPAEAIQFRDFASWQLAWLQSQAGERATTFWREHFAQPVEALQLPARAPRPALMQSEGASLEFDVDTQVWSGFKQRLAALGLSDFAGLFAALQLVLARLSSQRDFCIGTAVAGRQHQQLETVIGFFVNVLPLRSTLEFAHPVEDFLRAVSREVAACLSHQGVPFDTIVANLDLARDPSRAPLFDVLLVLQNAEMADLRFGEQVAAVQPLASATSQYDLSLSAFPAPDGSLKLIAEYDTAIYGAANIALVLRCLERVMRGLTESHVANVAQVPWLQDDDLAQVRAFEGAPQISVPMALPALVRRVAPNAKGRISDEANDWSYVELTQEMTRLGQLLRAALPKRSEGRKQSHIGVAGKRSARSVAAMLGVMDAGAVYVPLDLSNPVERLLAIVEEGALDAVLSTDAEGAALVAALQREHAALRHVHYADVALVAGAPQEAVDPADVAYMIFTSGSTGRPKGVQISHAAFLAMIEQQIPAFDVQADDVCAQFAALSFDASLSEIFLALGTGASLAVAPDAVRGDIDAFMQWLHAKAITVITLPPVFLRALDQRDLGTLRVLITAGEAAIAEDLRHYAAALRVINAYGPTETSVCATTYTVNARDAWPFGVPIGAPLPGVLLSVRDAAGARVPVGVTGELYIGGATVAAGYFGSPELSAQKFGAIAGAAEAGRWYRSGDLVRWRDDGLLEFQGRADTQVKVRGYRIEPGEIEHAARRVDGVNDAVALVHPQLGLQLYCVAPTALDADALRARILAALGKTLPRHMIPGDVLLLDAFPLSSAGKIARAALLALASTRERPFVPPATAEEEALAQAWCHALKVERVGRDDDFFALGGDSIKALEVLNRLRPLGFTCALKDFFVAPVLSAMAATLSVWQETQQFQQALAGPIALLPAQQWFLTSRSHAAARHFHIVVELQVSARVSEPLLREALATLVRSHDSLRARFHEMDGRWIQEIRPTVDMQTVLSTYRRTGAADGEAIEAQACRPFALEAAPLFRAILVQSPEGGSESLVLALHHLIADWVSVRLLVADLNAVAQALLNGEDAFLPPPHLLQVLAQERAVQTQEIVSDDYRKAVATKAARCGSSGVHGAVQTLHQRVEPAALAQLRDSLQHHGGGLQDLMLAAVVASFRGLFGVAEVPLLVEGHGRDSALDLARQVAWLTRARLINLDLAVFKDLDADALRQANRLLRASVDSAPDAFACVAADPTARGDLPALLSFNYLGEFTQGQEAAAPLFSLMDTVFTQAMAPDSPVDVPLHLEFYVVNAVLEIQLAWSPEVFDSAVVKAGWEQLCRTVAGFR